MAIDTRYLMSPSLQQYFVDKDTGFPLAAGEVYFFEDNNRSQPKSVYKISGSPPDYIFIPIGNKITLSSVGTMQDDLGNDFIPYLLPEDADGNLQFYYVEIYSAGGPTDGILQFTRQAWPPEAAQGGGVEQDESPINLIPNGQFALHNNIPEDIVNNRPVGRIVNAVTDVAPGGWTFERPSTSTATDTVTFIRFPAYTEDPTSSPRYEISIASNGGSPSDTFKDLCVKFHDVNKFASDEQMYTIFFSGKSNSGGDTTLSLNLIKNYGTGGDPQEVINIDDFVLTAIRQDFTASFLWGANSGKLIGLLNDDFCQLAFSTETNANISIVLTDFVYLPGDINITNFPVTTDEDFVDRSLVPPIPGFNAETYGLPLISTAKGLDFDYSVVGKIHPISSPFPQRGDLLCDGATIRTDGFFPDGVPCSRLRNAFMDYSLFTEEMPIWGTGRDYVTASALNSGIPADRALIIAANNFGVSSTPANGGISPGFTYAEVAPGVASLSVYNLNSWTFQSADSIWVESTVNGITGACVSTPTSNISMFGNSQPNGGATIYPFCNPDIGEKYGTLSSKMLVEATVAALPNPGSYIRIRLPASVNDMVFWFNVDGTGVQPVVPGINTYVRVNLFASEFTSIFDIAYVLSRAMAGAKVSIVGTTNGSTIPNSSYFTYSIGTQLYYVWYSLNNTGIDPAISGAIGAKVIYSTSDTRSVISLATASAINRLYYGLPDLRGWVIKGWDPTSINDSRTAFRFMKDGNRINSTNNLNYLPGNYQFDCKAGDVVGGQVQALVTPADIYPGYGPADLTNPRRFTPGSQTANFGYSGAVQTDVKNVSLNYVIKY
jgi:hypothetical protein